MSKPKPATIAGIPFRTRGELDARMSAILNATPLGQRIVGDDARLVAAMFETHPARDEKLAGQEISHFEVRKTAWPTIAFHVVRADGSAIDFTTTKCGR